MRKREAFTLVELLVVIGILALMASILVPALAAVRRNARMTAEVSAARQLMTGFVNYTTEYNGKIIPARYVSGTAQTLDNSGNLVTAQAAARYPWRLMPYLNGHLKGGLLVNKQAVELGERGNRELAAWHYEVSVNPSFGINAFGVGGTMAEVSDQHIERMSEATNPSALIVFVSARDDGGVEGFHQVRKPGDAATYKESDGAAIFGNIHPRYKGRAVVAFLDSHVDMLDTTELKKIEHWRERRKLVSPR